MTKLIFQSKKAFQRIRQILKDFAYNLFHYSPLYAINSLCWWLAYYHRSEGKAVAFFWRRKKTYILKYLKKNCPDSWTYMENCSHSFEELSPVENFRLWVFWYQGMESAPELVKICYRQLRRNCGEKVVLLTKDNLKDYVDLPGYIYEKVKNGKISLTHFSDIIRVSLLAQYGGIWIDATCWTSSVPPSWILDAPFYSCKISQNSLWRGWLMGTGKVGYPLFVVLRNFLYEYWEIKNHLIDYLLLDHLLVLAFENIHQIHRDMLTLRENNINRSELYNFLSSEWNEEIYEKICFDTWCFKLSWKTSFPERTSTGGETFFGWMKKESLKKENASD